MHEFIFLQPKYKNFKSKKILTRKTLTSLQSGKLNHVRSVDDEETIWEQIQTKEQNEILRRSCNSDSFFEVDTVRR